MAVCTVTEAAKTDGANIQLWSYWGADCQQWRFIEAESGYYQIVARHSGKVLEVAGSSAANGANVQQ